MILVLVAAVAIVLVGVYFATLTPPTPQLTESSQSTFGMVLTSSAFQDGGRIPQKYTCDGENTSPPLSWTGAPEGTKTFALIVDDPDAPGGTFTHWVIFNIPATEDNLPASIPNTPTLSAGVMQGINGAGKIGYAGPCPPSGVHHYVFTLYALDTTLNLQPGSTKQDTLNSMQGHILAQTQITGLYSKG